MANPSPHAARLAKRRAHKPLDLDAVLRILTSAVREAERLLYEAADPDVTLRCVHALSQACGQYAKLIAVGEYETRLARIEQWMEISANAPLLPADTPPLGRGRNGAADDPPGHGQGPQWP